MSRSRYSRDPKGMAAFMASDPALQRAMTSVAEEGKAFAEGISPVATGQYAGSFGVEKGGASPKDKRASATLFNESDHAARVEYEVRPVLAETASVLKAGTRR